MKYIQIHIINFMKFSDIRKRCDERSHRIWIFQINRTQREVSALEIKQFKFYN